MDKLYPVLLVLAALILLYILWCFVEPFFLDMDEAALKKSSNKDNNKNIKIKKLPMKSKDTKEAPDFCFFFFSDVHAEWCPVNARRLCDAIRKSHAAGHLDAVIFGGDIITSPSKAETGYKYINTVSACCKELGIPFYGISGNHDVRLTDAPGNAGFTALDNKTITITSESSGKSAVLAGIPDSGKHNRVWYQMPPIDSQDPVILIVHDPDAFIHLDPSSRPDFMLSGHLHGGQMKFPFKIEFTVLRKTDKLPNMGAVQGTYDINGTQVFISRGLGCGILPFRFLSVPEATLTKIHLK